MRSTPMAPTPMARIRLRFAAWSHAGPQWVLAVLQISSVLAANRVWDIPRRA